MTTTARYVALLRGVNVGGRNVVAMADLRAAFEAAGLRAVRTYIQSGNVLFETDDRRDALEGGLEAMLAERFGAPLRVVVRSHRQLRRVVDQAPDGFGADPGAFRADVIFLKAPLTARRAMAAFQPREGVDRVWPGAGAVYVARAGDRLTQSRLPTIARTAEYQSMTIRNWATTTRLLALLDATAAPPS